MLASRISRIALLAVLMCCVSFGINAEFTVLASTYTNTVTGTTIAGNLGYTTGPAMSPAVVGSTHVADAAYSAAGTDQANTLISLNSLSCTFTFSAGAVDLSTDTSHGPVGIYTPGVYCFNAAVNIGGTINLSGIGKYVFRMDGALTTSADSIITLSNGASSCNVWWTPTAATTLGANSIFVGTNIDAAGITIGNLATWTGRALAFGGTVKTSDNTIAAPAACASQYDVVSDHPSSASSIWVSNSLLTLFIANLAVAFLFAWSL